MNVFEDLIIELKEENLLEKTVDDLARQAAAERNKAEKPVWPPPPTDEPAKKPQPDNLPEETIEIETTGIAEVQPLEERRRDKSPRTPRNGSEFYKKRAVGELSHLQMVEHVLTGVEREYLKIVPNSYDDFSAKKALHAFLHVAENETSEQHAAAEFALMAETESWCSALGTRDANLPVSSVRLYCENSRPPLSSQALVALARFYRNLPYSETVRAKFDFVMTRLFSRVDDTGTRVGLFTRDEMLAHINTLYKEWSSIALYSAGDDDSEMLLTVLSFEDLSIEAENAAGFDDLVEGGFFNRLSTFKQSISEAFYAPLITAAAVECNIRVGNAYVKLISLERQKTDTESIQTKYGEENDQEASDAAGHTLDLVGILSQPAYVALPEEDDVEAATPPPSIEEERTDARALTSTRVPPVVKPQPATRPRTPFFGNVVENALSMNRWFLGVSLFLIAASIGIYIWSNTMTQDVPTTGVQTVELENNAAQEYVHTARVSNETFYALMHPTWDELPKERRIEVLKAIYQAAIEKNCKQVRLTNRQGKAAGYATATRTEVIMP